METTFLESQFLTNQKLVKLIFKTTFVAFVVGAIFGLIQDSSMFEIFTTFFLFTLALYVSFSKIGMKTKVDTTTLYIKHPFVGNMKVILSEIVSVEKTNFKFPPNRKSYHKKFGTLYRMYGNNGLLIKMKNKNSVYLGSQKVENLEDAIQSKLNKKMD